MLCCETSYIDRQIPQFLDHKHYFIPIYLFVALYSEQFLVLLLLFMEHTFYNLTRDHCFQVDFRAACQCHSKMTDVGYVCSVCMSVYCNFRPMCMTCNAHFKLPTALLKGKKVTGKRKLENGKS